MDDLTEMLEGTLTPLISRAIQMAARNLELPEGAVFHSDRGSNYTSAEFAGVLKDLGVRQSHSRPVRGRASPSTPSPTSIPRP